MSSTAPGKSQIARDMRELADTVRVQQDKAAKYVFGEKDGAAFMERLKTLDTRYRRLVEATGGGTVDGVVKAAALKGEAGRDADRKFRAFAHDDPAAIAAWDAMRKGTSLVRALGFMQHIPVVEKAIPQKLVDYLQARASGDPAKFIDFLKRDPAVNQGVRDFAADAARRGAVMQ
jgi:hypothetical protein